MEIQRDTYEIARVKKWAEEREISTPIFLGFEEGDFDDGYSRGVLDTLAWLAGEAHRAPDE